MMYIISGKYKGRKIESHDEKTLRPTSGKARAAVFNIITHGRFFAENNPIVGARVLDLFCGTGAMGLEAFSRGAEHVIFVDQNPKSISVARKNAERIGETKNSRLIVSDSTKVSGIKTPCSLVFIDPPYNSGLASPAIKNLVENKSLKDGAIIVVEVHSRDILELPPNIKIISERNYGKTKITILEYALNSLR